MIAKFENDVKNPFSQSKSDEKGVKESSLPSKVAQQKAEALMHSILHDFPAEEQFFSHNFD